jgi:aryl-alcohol dehydrogenase-like predicted oxidoreductase
MNKHSANKPGANTPSAAAAGQFAIGGDLPVNRLGFGAMRITGQGIWGEPDDLGEALRTLRRLRELDVNFIDTAEAYGPDVSERLIREALHPYDGIVVATKAGLQRPGPGRWTPDGRPEVLRRGVMGSLERLGIARLDLWQLHRIDPAVPRDEQFGVIADMQREGLIRHVGLSNVSLAEIEAAQKRFKVATVQNRYNLRDRSSEAELDFCEAHGIGFIPWFPLGSGDLARSGSAVESLARKYRAAPGQIALAWMLKRSKAMLPIPGTGKVAHLEENVAAAALELSQDDFAALDAQAQAS